MSKKPRKPRPLKIAIYEEMRTLKVEDIDDLKGAKRIHEWLGRAIKYLEGKET